MDLRLTGKNALITGGTHGIGLATAIALAKEGCNIAICSRTSERIKSTLQKLDNENIKSIGMQVNVLKPKEINKFCENVIDNWGTIHILIILLHKK